MIDVPTLWFIWDGASCEASATGHVSQLTNSTVELEWCQRPSKCELIVRLENFTFSLNRTQHEAAWKLDYKCSVCVLRSYSIRRV